MSTVMNVAFISKIKQAFPVDKERATWMGKFYSAANLSSGFCQFGLMPRLMPLLEPRHVWVFMPTLMSLLNLFQWANDNVSLYIVSSGFLLMKTMEYSLRGTVNEMLYVPLDFESRYVGKEVIGMFGYRLGKSGTSIFLTILGTIVECGVSELSMLSGGFALVWLYSAHRLAPFVPLRHKKERKEKGKEK